MSLSTILTETCHNIERRNFAEDRMKMLNGQALSPECHVLLRARLLRLNSCSPKGEAAATNPLSGRHECANWCSTEANHRLNRDSGPAQLRLRRSSQSNIIGLQMRNSIRTKSNEIATGELSKLLLCTMLMYCGPTYIIVS